MRKRWLLLIGTLIMAMVALGYYLMILPAPEKQPSQPQKYTYYKIIDQKSGKTLMTISSGPVAKGDQLITEDNRRYVVIEVKENRAYAKFVEKVAKTMSERRKRLDEYIREI